jgi:hypothetical protein
MSRWPVDEGEEGGERLEKGVPGGVDRLELEPGSEDGVYGIKNGPHFMYVVVLVAFFGEAYLAID